MATADQAREEFAKYVSYADIDPYCLDMLSSFLMRCVADHNLGAGEDGVRMFVRRFERAKWGKGGGLKEAYIRVDGDYFRDRECVSFNRDGYVGLCGWASSENAEPVAAGFVRWCRWMGERKGGAELAAGTRQKGDAE